MPSKSVTVHARLSTKEMPGVEAILEATISERIAALPKLDKTQLIKAWEANFGKTPPAHLRKELMVPLLAYRIQEKEYGGLSHVARRRLREIAQSMTAGRRPDTSTTPKLKSGTRLIRSWQGDVHEVSVNDDGFTYRGQQYGSLSKIAREITGTQWSGPAFFGIQKKAS